MKRHIKYYTFCLPFVLLCTFANLESDAQNKFTLLYDSGKAEQYNVKSIRLTFNNNGVCSRWKDGQKSEINFNAINKIYFTEAALPPVADAGPDQVVNEGTVVFLNGTTSYDPGGSTLTYHWEGPLGISLSSNNISEPSFKAPEVKSDSTFTFTLVVNDGFVDSPPATVNITVKNVMNVGVPIFSEAGVKVYPNPTTGEVFVEFSEPGSVSFGITLVNANGQVAANWDSKGSSSMKLDINHLPDGIYFLKLNSITKSYNTRILLLRNE